MPQHLVQSQQTRLAQKLNPKQVILGRLLEMSALEIEDEVRRNLDENPALEVVSDSYSKDSENTTADDFNETAEQLQQADYNDDDDMPSTYFNASSTSGFESLTDADQSSFYDIMNAQLAELDLSDTQRKIAEHIIGNIDENGYMTRSLPDIADDIAIAEGIDVDLSVVREVFKLIRTLDPAGIAAVDLRDCLLLQIDRQPKSFTTRIAAEIIGDCFDLFSKKHFEALRSHIGISTEELSDALDFIKTLNPKPGSLLETTSKQDRLRHIIPDFAVEIDSDGHTTVSLLNTTPELAIEQSFQISDLPDAPSSRRQLEASAFINRRREDAQSFIDMLQLRAETLIAVMRAIVEIQHKFFISGDQTDIRPMIIKDIASLTGLSISVISRAAAGKYVLTPTGIYPLKMFFNERPKDDLDSSSHQILAVLGQLINDEDHHHPLSDDALCKELNDQGFNLARRTVTKYRERLGLPVARLRKQL